jgi:hypothetical protein
MKERKKERVFLLSFFMLFICCYGSLQSQSIQFVERIEGENPLENVTTVSSIISSPVDIDNDGDFDLIIGTDIGKVKFYKNIGTEENPNLFEPQLEDDNPLNSIDLGSKVVPVFVDIDGDNDLDVFLGSNNKISYYKNTGSISVPVFEEQIEHNNPLVSIPNDGNKDFFTAFVDIDSDDDLDVFIGWVDSSVDSQGILFYKNTGSMASPSFENQTGDNNPFETFDKLYPIPTFVDMDGDRDLDVFIETGNGKYQYYENTTDLTLDVVEIDLKSAMMYPNPANNKVTINVIDNETTVRVVTMSGMEIYRTVLRKENKTIDVRSFDPGIYLVLIESGSLKVTKKLVVTK